MKNGWMTDRFGDKCHYKNDKYHSINDEPALIRKSGTKMWLKNGELHRENDLPAVIYYDGEKEYYLNNKRHRTNGPAIEHPKGYKEYWINDKRLSKEEFDEKFQEAIAEEAPTNENYPHTCPNCKSPAYISFLNEIDCSNCKGV